MESVTITVHPPAIPACPRRRAERHLEVVHGSGIEVNGTTSEPIRSARILQDRGAPIEATVIANSAGAEQRAFHIEPEQWIASQSGPYRLELVNEAGLAGVVGQWNLRVDPDSPPSVSGSGRAMIFVLPRAIVPIRIVVKDDLADPAGRSYLRPERQVGIRTGHAAQRARRSNCIAARKCRPSARQHARRESCGRICLGSRTIAVAVGAVVTVVAEAADYRPDVGRTVGPRRISIINAEELETRLADRQSQIVRQLERCSRWNARHGKTLIEIAIQVHDAGGLTKLDRTTLQTAEPNQIAVRRMLVDPAEGVMPLVDGILSEIEINRLENSETGCGNEPASRRTEAIVGRAVEYCRAGTYICAEDRPKRSLHWLR